MKIAIVGYGYVGTGMQKIFPEAVIIDPPKRIGKFEDALGFDLAVVCVPSPQADDGSCDTSIVRDAVKALDAMNVRTILIKSTVPPGTCDFLESICNRSNIVFSPEYMGESKYYTPPQFPDPRNPVSHGFVILGGPTLDCEFIADLLLPRLGPATRIRFMTRLEAEIVKYSENSFFALKVTFANLMRRICDRHLASYTTVREGWLDDPRVGPMFSAAFKAEPGFAGKCLPKDISALAAHCREIGVDATLLEAVIAANRRGS